MLDGEFRVDIRIPVSIFRVPATLSVVNPKAYAPQVIGLGPYHHFRSDLYEMERFKLAAVSRLQKQFQYLNFKDLIEKLGELEHHIRACYHKYLDLDGETLTWAMAIDGLYLLELLQLYTGQKDGPPSSSKPGHLVDSSGRKLVHDAILSDIMMLENQIPIFLFSKIFSIQASVPDPCDQMLPSMLVNFCKALSPLKSRVDIQLSEVCSHAHLLDLLYHLIVPELEGIETGGSYEKMGAASFSGVEDMASDNSHQAFTKLWNFVSYLKLGFVTSITNKVKKIINVPLKITSGTPGVSSLKSHIKERINPENKVSSDEDHNIPKLEEIMIPSASLLYEAGVQFCPSSGGIMTVKFDPKTRQFRLPVITLNVHTEVIMRNLVAYEASVQSESLVFTGYAELMFGIIDTAEDVKLLRQSKVIVNGLKSDAEVAELFNGMGKLIRHSKVSFMDTAIGAVNKYYYSTGKVRLYNIMKKYVYNSWRVLALFGAVLFMLLTALQSFCTICSCPHIFNTLEKT
ncbi:hypothetical protein NMG60_11013168 [Bertholletia excelsa]